ncbi:hypothetical protein VTL71DRAFT_12879 [Oculimacula yallundae]|uniref:Uncharacterized protein n=1 Tax=Oculimacula yallundae TaxID=86028 RepID=A0ABR4CRE2_9HELO
MYRPRASFPALLAFAIQLLQPAAAQGFHVKALEPSSPGQIGVNLVDYVGKNTQYYSADATTTKWIGVDTVIVQTVTQTSNGAVMTVTTSAAIAVSTAIVAGDGMEVGDVIFTITPSAKIQLEELFKKIAAVCGAAKLKPRQGGSCVADYIVEHAAAESVINDVYVAKFLNSAGNLVEYTWEAIKDFEITAEAEIVLGGMAVAYIGYQSWNPNGSDGQRVPDVVRIAASHIATHTVEPTSTETSDRPGRTPPPVLENLYNSVAEPFNTEFAQALATALENRFASLTTLAAAVMMTAAPNACQCVQLVAADGTLGAFDCTNLGEGARCDVITSTQASIPAATYIPLRPVPDPPSPAVCNFGVTPPATTAAVRISSEGFDFSGTFNWVAASKAITKFCKDHPYPVAGLLDNCASHESYVFQGEKINDGGGKGVLGNFERIFLSMRWDLGWCPKDTWWARNATEGSGIETSEAGKYLNGGTATYDDCVSGFSSALSLCGEKDKPTHGSKIYYKCMEFLMFQSGDVKFKFPCNHDVW